MNKKMFQLSELVRILPNTESFGHLRSEWNGEVSIDSRTILPGQVFFAIRGDKCDGHHYIQEACDRGAIGVVLEKQYLDNIRKMISCFNKPFVLVDDSLKAFQKWASYYHSLFSTKDICITGSNGKTTTKELIAHFLSLKYQVLKSQGNYNNEIGVPLTLLNTAKKHEVLVLEMAARKVGEIKELTDLVKPNIAVITNIGEAHIGLFGSRNNIAQEKTEIITALKENGIAILNRDDEYFPFIQKKIRPDLQMITYGLQEDSQVSAKNIKSIREKGYEFDLYIDGKIYPRVFSHLLGQFNIYNLLAAIAVSYRMEVPIGEIIQNIRTFKNKEDRMKKVISGSGMTLILDCYNASPSSVKKALKAIEEISGEKKKIAILGDMLELGIHTMEYHREVGRDAVLQSFDLIFAIGEYARWIKEGALEEGINEKSVYCFNRSEMNIIVQQLIHLIPRNSIILVKGSRDLKLEEIVQAWIEKKDSKGYDSHVNE